MRGLVIIFLLAWMPQVFAFSCDLKAPKGGKMAFKCKEVGAKEAAFLRFACAKFRGQTLGTILNDKRIPKGVMTRSKTMRSIPKWTHNKMMLRQCSIASSSQQATIQFVQFRR